MYGVELLVRNSRELDEIGGIFTGNIFRKCSALSLTIRGEKANKDRINEAIKIIEKNTSILSRFRGNNLLMVAITMAISEEMNEALEDINSIYNKLKKKFFNRQYLILTAIAIYNRKDKVSIDRVVEDTGIVYQKMKAEHRFLTGQEDILTAAMIATNSRNIDFTMEKTKAYYEKLNNNGFRKGNNLKILSSVLVLFEGNVDEKVNRVVEAEKALKKHSVPMKGYGIPMLSIVSLVEDDLDLFAEKVRNINKTLRVEKGFGNLKLGYKIRSIIAIAIAMIEYMETLESKEAVVDINNDIVLILEIIITAMIIKLVAASASTNSSE